jgi:sulfopyruvate decarboxylase TPP-binding subunit
MASTITNTDLVVTINEQIIINGQPINSENILTISNINEVDKRIMTIPFASEITVMNFGVGAAAGTYIVGDVKYIRITNKDTVNFVRIRVLKSTADTFDIQLDAGKSFIMGNTNESVSESEAAFSAFETISAISARADTANVDIEFFIGLT